MTNHISPCAEYELEIAALINQQNLDVAEIERLRKLADNQAAQLKELMELVTETREAFGKIDIYEEYPEGHEGRFWAETASMYLHPGEAVANVDMFSIDKVVEKYNTWKNNRS